MAQQLKQSDAVTAAEGQQVKLQLGPDLGTAATARSNTSCLCVDCQDPLVMQATGAVSSCDVAAAVPAGVC